MRIVTVTSEQFRIIWTKMFPAERISAAIPTPNIVLQAENTLIVLEGETAMSNLGDVGEPFSLANTFAKIKTFPSRSNEGDQDGR